MLIDIHDKVRHAGIICRVAIVNLTDQIRPKRVEMSYKQKDKKKMTQCLIFLFANETKGTFCVFQPRNPSIQPKTSHQSNLSMKTADQIRELYRTRANNRQFPLTMFLMRSNNNNYAILVLILLIIHNGCPAASFRSACLNFIGKTNSVF